MKTGRTLTELAMELERQNNAKQDYLVDTRELTLLPPVIDEDGAAKGTAELHLPNGEEFALHGVAPRQIASHLKIPAKYWDMLESDHRNLLATNVNTLFREKPARRMVRCLDYADDGGRYARAFLSDRYQRRDNYDVAQAAIAVMQEIADVRIPTSEITDSHLYISALAPRVQADVKVGDTVQAGVRITNSEVGKGALKIEPIVFRLLCLNGMTVAKATRVYHIGSTLGLEEDETQRVLSDQTMELDDRAFFAKLADVMRAAVDETQFNAIVAQMREAAGGPALAKPLEAMETLGKRFSFTQPEQENILQHLVTGGDLTAWGTLNAVTRAAQDVESYDRSMELEQVGGQILEMAGGREWAALAAR
jgi:hypothetical protein